MKVLLLLVIWSFRGPKQRKVEVDLDDVHPNNFLPGHSDVVF